MNDPKLDARLFLPDRVVTRETISQALDGAAGDVATPQACGENLRSTQEFRIWVHPSDPDLSRFNVLCLNVSNRSGSPLLAGIRLVHGPDLGESGSRDVSFSGGREPLPPLSRTALDFPAQSLGWYGSCDGWKHVRSIELFFGPEKTAPRPAGVDVVLEGICGEFREVPKGPRLTRDGLREALARDFPGVTAFFGPEAGHHSAAGKTATPSVSWEPYVAGNAGLLIPPPHPYPRETPAEIVEGRIMGQRLPDPIAWDADPLGIQEWTHFLNRHHFLRELVLGVAETGEERYTRAVDRAISGWIATNPVPIGSNGGAGPAWETLSTAWRLREWLWVIGIVWPHPVFRNATKLDMLRSLWEHCRSLLDHQGHPNNWIIVESAALALAGICLPQFRESRLWLETGVARLAVEFRRQFFDDGVHFEISPLYHAICLNAFLEVKEAAAAREVSLPKEFGAPLERCADYLIGLCRPDFTWPSLNDSGSAAGDFRALMGKAGEMFGRSDLRWIGTRGVSGTPPSRTSFVFPDAGISIMRSHWGTDANVLIFRAGPPGATHVHDDVLSLDVTALGMPRLPDPGITTYAPDSLTDYYRSAGAHNMVLIDGRGSERTGLAFADRIRAAGSRFSHVRQENLEIVSGVCHGPWNGSNEEMAHGRTVVSVNAEYWIVRDCLFGTGVHEVTTCWQFWPGRVDIDFVTFVVRCLDARGPRFELIPLTGSHLLEIEQTTGALNPPRGWISLAGADFPCTSFRYILSGELPLTLVWILLPYSGSAVSGVKARHRDVNGDNVSLEIEFPAGHTDRFSLVQPTSEDLRDGGLKLHGKVSFSRTRKG